MSNRESYDVPNGFFIDDEKPETERLKEKIKELEERIHKKNKALIKSADALNSMRTRGTYFLVGNVIEELITAVNI